MDYIMVPIVASSSFPHHVVRKLELAGYQQPPSDEFCCEGGAAASVAVSGGLTLSQELLTKQGDVSRKNCWSRL